MSFETETNHGHGHEKRAVLHPFPSYHSARRSVPQSCAGVRRSAYPWLFALCVLLSALAPSDSAQCGSISLTTQVTVSVTGERLYGFVRVNNGGNAPAHRVRVDLTLPGARIRPPGEHTLGVSRSADFPFEARLESPQKGRHPLSVMVHFQDSIGHPFSALTVTTFLVQQEKAPDLLARGEPLVMADRGTVRFQLENTGALPRAVKASLLLPWEFLLEKKLWEDTIPGGRRMAVESRAANLSALSGATYPVFCVVEYDEEETHQTVIGMTTIHVRSGGNWFRRTRWRWAGGLVLLGLFLGAAGTSLGKRSRIRNARKCIRLG
ncbi:MAG: hypothetical protein JXL84_05105 [Deltaproteobacteria bacterium]|nr:hypothetical protein [Deltaproteobacteria bacterium]